MFALDRMGDLKLWISDLESTAASGPDSSIERSFLGRRLCFGRDGKPDLDVLSSEQIRRVCKPDTILTTEPEQFYDDLGFSNSLTS